MTSNIPSNCDNISIFELLAAIGADRAVNTYQPSKLPEWKQAYDKLQEMINKLLETGAKQVEIENLRNQATVFECTVIDTMYKYGFSDGIHFIIETLTGKKVT